ncbi:MAG: tRNA 2-thiouridine(34) synthase MnmA, partial [Planctomycetota bacterium]
RDRGERDVTAFYLKIWLEDELSFLGTCPWEEDLEVARAVCELAGVPLEVISLQREYYDRVVSYTIAELQAGRTPSPDIFCNQRVKFGAFFDAVGSDFDRVVSGHYAQVRETGGNYQLLRGVDPVKDQSYFLSHLNHDQISRLEFPIGSLPKSKVREIAESAKLPNAARRDSQGICFLGKLKFDDFVRAHLGDRPGQIVDAETGKTLGGHRGYWFHTIGQRRGLGLSGGPWFVAGKDTDRNVVFVRHGERLERNVVSDYEVSELHWIGGHAAETRELTVKLRHGPKLTPATVEFVSEDRLRVKLAEGDAGVAPGQFTVFYEGEVCLGAGKICADPSGPEGSLSSD